MGARAWRLRSRIAPTFTANPWSADSQQSTNGPWWIQRHSSSTRDPEVTPTRTEREQDMGVFPLQANEIIEKSEFAARSPTENGAQSTDGRGQANMRTCITHRYAGQSKPGDNSLFSPVPPQWTAVGVHWTGGNGRPIRANPSAEQAAGKGLHRPKAASPAERFKRLESHGKERKRCPAQEGGAKGLSHRPQKWVHELVRH